MKIGFIGGGKMGEAIMADLVRSELVGAHDVGVCELDAERRAALQSRYGVSVFADALPLLRFAQIVFLAVKPQDLDGVLNGLASGVTPDHLLISIAAGKRLEQIEKALPDSARVVRVMPNLATLVSEGMSVFCVGRSVAAQDRDTVSKLLACFGRVLELDEQYFDAVTALSGSGPAFFAHFAQLMIEGGTGLGLERQDAELLAGQTMLGTARLLATGVYDGPADLIAAVSSKGGTTVAGMQVFDRTPIKDTVAAALGAAASRSRELTKDT